MLDGQKKYQRSRGTESFSVLQEIFASKRRTLNKMIKRSKKECFQKLCNDVDVNPWVQAYRIVMKKLNGFKQAMPESDSCRSPSALRVVPV